VHKVLDRHRLSFASVPCGPFYAAQSSCSRRIQGTEAA
jgi:hypothetical protein